ncbi:hypothetical protein LUZ60_004918 [Juncus effusus]|nr:hypothetical protein LUZ60_004918 [Juncus effusus]
MEVLRVLSPRPGGRSPGSNLRPKSPAGKSSRSGGQENTPPPHPNMNLPSGIKSPPLSKSERLSVSIPKCNSVIMQEEEVASVDSLPLDPDSDASVKVAVRVRSMNVNDRIVRKLSDQALSIGDRAFNFNSVFGPQSTQEEIFNSIGVPLVQNALAGFNTSVVSYGQTGTGKTHTMWGPPSAMVNVCSLDAKLGLVPRFFRMLFSEIEKRQEGSKQKQINYQCRCSFLEIYNEQINDLLDPTQRDLQIREDTINGIHVENLTDEYVTCHEDISQILIKGLSNRKVGASSLNSKSSRSHVMFTFVLESWSKQTGSSNFSSSKSSIITFVDLAGQDKDEFEQKKKDCTKEERFVKKSLSRLGKLVNILSDRKDQKVSYLGSSLTYLLQDTLGGNSKVTFLCHISSDKRSKAATLSTLRFGERAKQIENKPVINEISEDDVNGLSDQIRQLKEELIRAKSSDKSPSENFKGFNARKNLNLLRASLNRTLILPSIETESDSETELESNEKEITEFCAQISNSCTNLDEISLNSPISNENNEIVQKLSEKELEPEPTLCSSPRISMKLRKSIVSPKGLGFIRVSKDEVANVRSSIQSTKLSPTESLAASLHRGLNIIEENNNNINNDDNKELIRKSFVSLSFEHLALKNQSIETVDLSHHTDSEADKSFICTVCKASFLS